MESVYPLFFRLCDTWPVVWSGLSSAPAPAPLGITRDLSSREEASPWTCLLDRPVRSAMILRARSQKNNNITYPVDSNFQTRLSHSRTYFCAHVRAFVVFRGQETLDEWQTCQRTWMYLESIFGSPDIVRQLPAAAKMFQAVDRSWRHIMSITADEPLAIKQVVVKSKQTRCAT